MFITILAFDMLFYKGNDLYDIQYNLNKPFHSIWTHSFSMTSYLNVNQRADPLISTTMTVTPKTLLVMSRNIYSHHYLCRLFTLYFFNSQANVCILFMCQLTSGMSSKKARNNLLHQKFCRTILTCQKNFKMIMLVVLGF